MASAKEESVLADQSILKSRGSVWTSPKQQDPSLDFCVGGMTDVWASLTSGIYLSREGEKKKKKSRALSQSRQPKVVEETRSAPVLFFFFLASPTLRQEELSKENKDIPLKSLNDSFSSPPKRS